MIVLIRGGGDLASGVALRLYRAGLRVVITEMPQPLAVRRLVSFAEAVYSGETNVEGVAGRRVSDPTDTLSVLQVLAKGKIPVLVDPQGEAIQALHPHVVVDGRMTKRRAELIPIAIKLIIGLGPGFIAGENCHAVVETNRGHMLGRVIWQGAPEPNTGLPEAVGDRRFERVLRAAAAGVLKPIVEIGDHLEPGQLIAEVVPEDGGEAQPVLAPFKGVLRGLLHPGLPVQPGLKIGDVDPRDDPSFCSLVSDKSLAVGGGVLEAILSRPELRPQLWS
jgi:xanthine dehydrogenase accessory factor